MKKLRIKEFKQVPKITQLKRVAAAIQTQLTCLPGRRSPSHFAKLKKDKLVRCKREHDCNRKLNQKIEMSKAGDFERKQLSLV